MEEVIPSSRMEELTEKWCKFESCPAQKEFEMSASAFEIARQTIDREGQQLHIFVDRRDPSLCGFHCCKITTRRGDFYCRHFGVMLDSVEVVGEYGGNSSSVELGRRLEYCVEGEKTLL